MTNEKICGATNKDKIAGISVNDKGRIREVLN